MGRYTVSDDPRVDAFVGEHLNHIMQAVRGLMGNDLDAAVLTGGFGRGEGSVLVNDDSILRVINDYDIELFPRPRWGHRLDSLLAKLRYRIALERLASQLAEELNLKQVDLGLRDRASLAAIRTPHLADYDLKYGHQLLHGASNPVDNLPAYLPADIPAFEGAWLLRNRAIGLLLAFLYFNSDDSLANTENFYIEINKAALAMGDALFIESGNYACSYVQRAREIGRFAHLPFDNIGELIRLYTLAADYKLRPRLEMYPGISPRDLWHHMKDLYITFFLFFESRRLGRSFDNWPEYLAEYGPARRPQMRSWFKLLLPIMLGHVSLRMLPLLRLKQDRFRSVPFVMLLLASRGRDDLDLAAASVLARMLDNPYRGITNAHWLALVRDFLLVIHPGGEVGRFLGRSTVTR